MERIVSSVSEGSAEVLKSERILHVVREEDLKKNVDLFIKGWFD